MTGTSKINDHGTITFNFEDGTEAIITWEPYGEGGDGEGGSYSEENIEVNTSQFTSSEIVQLAYWNDMSGSIRAPEELRERLG